MIAGGSPLLSAHGITRAFGQNRGCFAVSLDIWPGEVVGIVGESGSGKTTLLNCLSTLMKPDLGRIKYTTREGRGVDLFELGEGERRMFARTDWGFVHQDPRQGLRMNVSAGANVAERLMAVGVRHYGQLRESASHWMGRVELDDQRMDESPTTYSGGMLQRLQIARNLAIRPRLLFMDEPTGGLDVSVQARLLDLMRGLVAELGVAAFVVTHDLGVARLLAHRLVVMKDGHIVEHGLTDQVLDDPQQPYTQLLVASVLPV
jgi:putative phosphonate transport system ATP-binding protein